MYFPHIPFHGIKKWVEKNTVYTLYTAYSNYIILFRFIYCSTLCSLHCLFSILKPAQQTHFGLLFSITHSCVHPNFPISSLNARYEFYTVIYTKYKPGASWTSNLFHCSWLNSSWPKSSCSFTLIASFLTDTFDKTNRTVQGYFEYEK